MGIEPPEHAEAPLDWVCDTLSQLCKDGFDRVLIHNPDAVLRAGKKVALVAPPTCSLANIFQGRDIHYYHCKNEGENAQQLIAPDEYDVICVYTYMFDTLNHRNGPEHPETLNALYRQGQFFDILVSTVKRCWKQHNTLVSFSPDHGVHEVAPYGSELNSKGKSVRGHHGSDRTQDLNILHYMGVVRRSDGKS